MKYDTTRRTQFADDLWYFRGLYDGDVAVTVQALKNRFVAAQERDYNAAEFDETARNFVIENELRPLVLERIEAVPTDLTLEQNKGEDGLLSALEDWLADDVTEDGRDMASLLGRVRVTHERDGRAVLVVGKREEDGRPYLGWRDADHVEEIWDPVDPNRVAGWHLEYSRILGEAMGGALMTESWSETWTADRVVRRYLTGPSAGTEAQEWVHGYGFIPLVVIPRTDDPGCLGRISGVAEMEQAYLNFLWASYLRNLCNKMTAHRQLVPEDERTATALQRAGTGGSSTTPTIRQSPGGVLRYRLKYIGGDLNLASIEKQIADSLATLRRLGRGERDKAGDTDLRAAKAKLMERTGLAMYTASKVKLITHGLQTALELVAVLLGDHTLGQPFGVRCALGESELQDDEESRLRGDLWTKAKQAGLATDAHWFRGWQALGLIPEEVDEDTYLQELQDGREEAEQRMLQTFGTGAPPKPGQPAPGQQDDDQDQGPQQAPDQAPGGDQ